MNYGRLGKKWESESRVFLEEKFDTPLIFKLINPERMDWIIFTNDQKIALVESKSTKKSHYYPFENKKKRNQLDNYVKIKQRVSLQGFVCSFYLLIKKKGAIIFQKIDKIEDIKRRY